MSKVSTRLARRDDVDPARKVLAAAYAEYESFLLPDDWVRYLADIIDLEGRASESELLVAESDSQVFGCVSYFPPGSKASYPSDSFSEHWPADWSAIRLLAVDPSVRGKGVGRLLTEVCIQRSREQLAPVMGLHTTAPMRIARDMYERMGFVRAPRYDFRPSPELPVEAYRLDL